MRKYVLLERVEGEGHESGKASRRLLASTIGASPYRHRLFVITRCLSLYKVDAFRVPKLHLGLVLYNTRILR